MADVHSVNVSRYAAMRHPSLHHLVDQYRGHWLLSSGAHHRSQSPRPGPRSVPHLPSFSLNHSAYGVFLTRWRFQSRAPSVHQTSPRSPSFRLAASIAARAASIPTSSFARSAAPFCLRAFINSTTRCCLVSSGRSGLVQRHKRPLTTKYRTSGVTESGIRFRNLMTDASEISVRTDLRPSHFPAANLKTRIRFGLSA
jgi:hypothetical protein